MPSRIHFLLVAGCFYHFATNLSLQAYGVANVIVNLQHMNGWDSTQDGFLNVTCNVNGEPVTMTLNATVGVNRYVHVLQYTIHVFLKWDAA